MVLQGDGAARDASPALPDKPSIAVLPFDNMSGDPEQDYFADGIVEDVITDLSRERDLFVIARNSTFAYKGQSPDIRQVAKELGVRYVLEGSVRKAGKRVRLNAQLIEAESGHHVWAERYDRALEDVFEVQDELTAAIFSTLCHKIPQAVAAGWAAKRPEDMSAYEHTIRAQLLTYNIDKTDNATAIQEVETALALDPGYGRAHATLAWALLYNLFIGLAEDTETWLKRAHQAALRAVEIDRGDFWAQGALGGTELFLGRHERAIAALERAVELSPNNADAHALRGFAFNFVGRPEEGLGRPQSRDAPQPAPSGLVPGGGEPLPFPARRLRRGTAPPAAPAGHQSRFPAGTPLEHRLSRIARRDGGGPNRGGGGVGERARLQSGESAGSCPLARPCRTGALHRPLAQGGPAGMTD